MRDRLPAPGVVGVVAGVLGLCCGLPVLMSLGLVGALAGVSTRSWVLLALGVVVAAVGAWRGTARRRAAACTRAPDGPASEERDEHGHDSGGRSTGARP